MKNTLYGPMSDPKRVVSNRSIHLSFVLFMVLLLWVQATRADEVLETPPLGPVRQPAEFEPMMGVLVEPLFGNEVRLPVEFIGDVAEDVKVFVSYKKDEEEMIRTRDWYSQHGVNLDNCVFCKTTGLNGQPRDGAPWFVFDGNGEAALVSYQRPHASALDRDPTYGLGQGYPVHRSGLHIWGGNYMTDGQGIAVSTDGMYQRNSDRLSEIPERMWDYLGVHTYHIIPDAYRASPGGSMEHVDCFAKLLAPDTVMALEYPPTDPDYQNLEETADYFRRQVSCYGTPYRVVRIFAPYEMPYANCLILNRKVYIPINGTEWDTAALASYEAAMPGYQVIGVPWTWRASDALHCRTMGIPDEQMLYIEHAPVLDRPSESEGFPIGARIIAYSRTGFVEGTPAVLWRALPDSNEPESETEIPAPWNIVPMIHQPELGDHQYLAHIPTQPVGTMIQYYLQAQDASGRNETHPYIGEAQAHTFTVKTLGANVSAVSAQRGGAIQIYMNAGQSYALQNYRLKCSLCLDDPSLPGSDMEHVIDVEIPAVADGILPETTVSSGFEGVLDDLGIGAAEMILSEPLNSDWSGGSLRFSLERDDPENTVVGAASVQILD